MNIFKRLIFFTLLFATIPDFISAQGFLHREGKYIFDGSGKEVILRGIGTGNWMIQEGYMMQTSGVAGTQHEFRNKLISTIGVEKTDSFYTAWLDSHFRRIDVDSMKSWGFNSIRVAMHYKWFTPPIEEEPVKGEITWLEKGFVMMDSLLSWCSDNEMYLILDMHGAPGGQGKNADISDYDPSKPSLWESQDNKNKLVALWKKLAERYSDEPWIGGYDLINETNWSLPNNNKDLWDLHKQITFAIREVDKNHLIFIEGNGFANDFSGLPAIWDNNLALSFHKYWSFNDAGSLDWMLNLRNGRNVPLWLGESGENSNVWFTELIALSEKNRIGWSWWPVKKPAINNVLNVSVNDDYTRLVNYWKGNASNPGVDAAFTAVLKFAENHRLENCTFQKDVVDAMIRQPQTTETIPFKIYKTGEPVFATDYNLGRNGFAYFDNDTANYNSSTGEYVNWNQGWAYRNDGVDIEKCSDKELSNGYNVGWTGNNEWLEYTVVADTTASYTLNIRSASGSGGSKIRLEINGQPSTKVLSLPSTSGWQNWRTTKTEGILLSKGIHKIKLIFEQGGSNLNYFSFTDPQPTNSVPFQQVFAETSVDGKYIILTLNKEISSPAENIKTTDFTITINNLPAEISSVQIPENNLNSVRLNMMNNLFYGGNIKLTYQGNTIFSSEQPLTNFTNETVKNNLPVRYSITSRIQAEDFHFNNGLVKETCSDVGGGYDMGYAAPGDYLDYLVYVPESAFYNLNYRIASQRSNSQIIVRIGEEQEFTAVDTITIPSTGGWQNWQTVTSTVFLPEGRYTLRNYVRTGEFNTNWFQGIKAPSTSAETHDLPELQIYPNPADHTVNISLSQIPGGDKEITIYNSLGKIVKKVISQSLSIVEINVKDLNKGLYFVTIRAGNNFCATSKLIVK